VGSGPRFTGEGADLDSDCPVTGRLTARNVSPDSSIEVLSNTSIRSLQTVSNTVTLIPEDQPVELALAIRRFIRDMLV
jgi:hypothetical protein